MILPLAVLALIASALTVDPAAGITVSLVGSNGQVMQSTTTDSSGVFRFLGVPAGTYSLRVEGPVHAASARPIGITEEGIKRATYDFFVRIEGTRASVKSPRDAASGQASGRLATEPGMMPIGTASVGESLRASAELTVSRGAAVAIRGVVHRDASRS